MVICLDLDWRGSRSGGHRCWCCDDLNNWWSSLCRSRRGSPVGVDGLHKDILNVNNTSLDDSLYHHRLITLMVYMGKGVAQLHVRMGKGASAEDERNKD